MKPLENLDIIDCSTMYAAPVTASLLGDFGANVIKIEHPERGDEVRHLDFADEIPWKWMSRNKKSLPLDLHDDRGAAVLKELVEETDVLIENFRPGTLERWGLGYETLTEANPELVMVRTTGFGQTGPYKDQPGYGTLADAFSGFAWVNGDPGGKPMLSSMALADYVSGLYSTFGTLIALYWRDAENGGGQYIDVSIFEPLFAMMGEFVMEYSYTGDLTTRQSGNRLPHIAPRNTYRTSDDRWIVISAGSEKIAKRVLEVVGGEELKQAEKYQTQADRIRNVEDLDAIIQEWIGTHDRETVLEILQEHEIPTAPVYNTEDIFEDPHYREREALIEVNDEEIGEVTMPGVFPKLSETPGEVRHTGPSLGEHTWEILTALTTLDEVEIQQLIDDGVTSVPESDTSESR